MDRVMSKGNAQTVSIYESLGWDDNVDESL